MAFPTSTISQKGVVSTLTQKNVSGTITQKGVVGSIVESGVVHTNDFVTKWNLPAGSFTYPLYPGATYDCIINWGDGSPEGTVTSSGDVDKVHTYVNAGIYTISIRGTFTRQYINRSAISGYLIEVVNWGNVGFTSMAYFACGCSNFTTIPNSAVTGATTVTSVESMFDECNLSSIPATIFDGMTSITDFTNCFAVNPAVTGNAPTLWLSFPTATGDYCFDGDTTLSNWALIPDTWGGPLSLMSAEYTLVHNSFTNKPSTADVTIQATMLDALVAGGYYAKAELLDVFSAHSNTAGESQKNWKNPGTFDPTLINSPAWTVYAGFMGDVAKGVDLNFNPTVNGTLVSQNNICAIIGVGTDLDANLSEFGAYDGAVYFNIKGRRTNNLRTRCNDATEQTVANVSSLKHITMSRGVAANYDIYLNLVKTNIVRASTGLINKTLYACGFNNNGALVACAKQLRYVFLFSYLTEAEVQGVIAIMEAYLDNYGTGLY